MNRIKGAWQQIEKDMPQGAGESQRLSCQLMFYSGALFLWKVLIHEMPRDPAKVIQHMADVNTDMQEIALEGCETSGRPS
ncbi:MAG: hypothetical protein NVS9B4_01000 [Candidatus Acidiferrum sp.]